VDQETFRSRKNLQQEVISVHVESTAFKVATLTPHQPVNLLKIDPGSATALPISPAIAVAIHPGTTRFTIAGRVAAIAPLQANVGIRAVNPVAAAAATVQPRRVIPAIIPIDGPRWIGSHHSTAHDAHNHGFRPFPQTAQNIAPLQVNFSY